MFKMDEGFLIATPLSSLSPVQPASFPIQTKRQKIPLPDNPHESDILSEHATYSCVLNTPTTGTILLRLLHGGLIIELISLTTQVAPIRLVFPAVVLPSPAIFLWESTEIHVLAVTDTGSLYRVVVPVSGLDLWQHQIDSIWPREYLIKSFAEERAAGLIHVQGTHCVAIAMPHGAFLRLEADFGYDGQDEEWVETLFQYGSFFSTLTSFLPSLNSGIPNGPDIISMATYPWPTDIGHVWSLSRDRTLRLWKAKLGCVASKSLTSITMGREPSPAAGSSGSGAKHHHLLLDAEPQTLLKVFPKRAQDDHIYVLAFIPTISSPTAGGSFRLIDTYVDQLHELGTLECSKNSAHCHLQDFMVVGNQLYTLWDRQGRSMVEKTTINPDDFNNTEHLAPPWRTASYAQEKELTPAHMEEQLGSAGSLTEKFFEAVVKPGTFSALTLRNAVEQYTDTCLSLPGPPPPQLTTTYATLAENIAAVVGCTVTMNRDPQTGVYQYANYWAALKRDWEGFVARCREIERSARWPLALATEGTDDIIIIERERAGSLLKEDLPIHLRRSILSDISIDPQYDLLAVLWAVQSKIGPQVMANLENCTTDIMHQEIAFSFADILQDQARRSQFKATLDEGSVAWLKGCLQRIGDVNAAIHTALDVIGGFDMEVKREEEEVELLLPTTQSEWSQALEASYITASIEARYDLCLSLITLFFFLSDELDSWEPSLLTEVFAVFRGVAILRFVASQPAGETSASSGTRASPDDVIARMRNMNVANAPSQSIPKCSLIQLLLAQSGEGNRLPAAAHRFLDSTGLLRSISPANATKFEVLFCERLRLLGFYEAARELLSWLPRTAGVTFVLAQVWLNVRRPDDASQLLQKLAGCFGPNSALTVEDQEALTAVLPDVHLFESEFSFYAWAAHTFMANFWVHHELVFANLAVSVAPIDVDVSSLWFNIVKGYIDLRLFEDAYASLMAMPYDKQKRECASHLAIRMCEENAVETLVAFDFSGIAEEVEAALSFKARNTDPGVRPYYSKILYAWYIQRGNYRSASLTMYQRARKLQESIVDATSFVTLAEEQLNACSIAVNALTLVDQKTAWVLMPISPDTPPESRKRRKLSKHIPENKYTTGKYDAEIVHLADMQYDHALLQAQIDIIRREPDIINSQEFLLAPPLIVLRLAQANQFTHAMATARSLNVDMSDLFTHLTRQCLRLSQNPNSVIQEDTSDWLLTDKVSSWPGTPAERGWRYLRLSLERHDNPETDYRYSKATLETILSTAKSSSPPPWLITLLEHHHPEYLIRASLRYENLEDAVNYTLSLIRKSDANLARESTRNISATWLPYTLIDQVLVAATSQDKPPRRLSELRTEIANRLKRVQKLSSSQR